MKKGVNMIINKLDEIKNKIKVIKLKSKYIKRIREVLTNKKIDLDNIFNIKSYKERIAFASIIVCGAVTLSIVGCKFSQATMELQNNNYVNLSNSKSSLDDNYIEETVSSNEDIDEKDIERVCATYSFDVTKIKNVVADADYTFVAKVDKILSTVYKYPVKIDDKWINVPYTKYRLKVLKNIKGNLKEGSYIEIQKAGGKIQNSNKYMAYDNDNLPNKQNVYIFSTYVQKDGSLLSTGRNSTIRIVSNYTKSVTYNNFMKVRNSRATKARVRYRINSKKVYK